MEHTNSTKQMELSVDIHPILLNMSFDQLDHQYATFGDIYSKYRRAVAGWMMEICDYFNLHPTTTHAAIAYLDRLQPNDRFSRNEWQMLAIACILISAKYNESEEHVPSRAVLEEITEQRISNKVILGFEIWILMKMSWKLSAFTPMSFLSCYMASGVTYASDRCSQFPTFQSRSQSLNTRIIAIANAVMLEESMKQYRASEIACAIVYIAREGYEINPVWKKELTELMRGVDPFNAAVSKLIRLISRLISSTPTEPSDSTNHIPASDSMLSPTTTPRVTSNDTIQSPESKENIKGTGYTSPVSVTDHIETSNYVL